MTNSVTPNSELYGQVLEKIAHEEGIEGVQIKITKGSKKGDNYMGEIYRVRIIGKTGGRFSKLNLILKTSTPALKRETIPAEEAYRRENFMYKTVFRELEKLQESEYLETQHKFSFVKCYYTNDVYMEEMIVLEDLKVQGFIMADRLKPPDIAHCALVMSALGKFHALSYVMKHKHPGRFEYLTDKCPDIICNGTFGKSVEKIFTQMARSFVAVIKNETLKVKINTFAANVNEKMKEAIKPTNFSVLLHGDCWINNTLFKYLDAVPVEIRLLDFQLSRFGSPAQDILYFIFGCTDRALRSTHYDNMLNIYHKSLEESLKAHSLEINCFLSKENLRSEIKNHSNFGLAMSMILIRTCVTDSDEAIDFQATMTKDINDTKMNTPTGPGYDRFVQRVNEVAEDFQEYGYLQ